MLKVKIKFSIVELQELEQTIHVQIIESSEVEQMPYVASLEIYILDLVWQRLQAKSALMERKRMMQGSMAFNQIEVDVIAKLVKPRNRIDGLIYGEFLRQISGRIEISKHLKIDRT